MENEPSSEARLKHQLDVQTRQINRVLSHHRIPAIVTGGTVRSRVVNFDLQSQLTAGVERIRGLGDDLKAALGVGGVSVSQRDGFWRVRVPQPDESPVPLLKLLSSLPTVAPSTAVIGMADGGQPVSVRFSSGRMSHILIAGEPGSGKTSLLRAIATGLAMTNRQSELQLQILDPKWEASVRPTATESPLIPLGYLPHMLTDPAFGMESCLSLIHFLAEEMNYRRREKVLFPRIVVLMDHVLTYLENITQAAKRDLYHLLQYGHQAGIHLIIATDRPESPLLDSTIKASLSMRIIGRLDDIAVARRIAGIPLDQATLLYGEGDFLAVSGDEVTYFQAAHIGDYDLHHTIAHITRNSRPILLAKPYSARPRLKAQSPPRNTSARVFAINDGTIDMEGSSDPHAIGQDVDNEIPF